MDLAKMVEQVQKLQSDLRNTTVEAASGGVISVQMNGRQELLRVTVFDGAYRLNKENLAGCIMDAFNQALEKSRQKVREEVTRYTGGLNLPNLSDLI